MHPLKRLLRRSVNAVGLCLLAGAALAQTSTQQEALHAINRLSFGPAPGDVARVMRMGVDHYIDEQLNPERLASALDTGTAARHPGEHTPLPRCIDCPVPPGVASR